MFPLHPFAPVRKSSRYYYVFGSSGSRGFFFMHIKNRSFSFNYFNKMFKKYNRPVTIIYVIPRLSRQY